MPSSIRGVGTIALNGLKRLMPVECQREASAHIATAALLPLKYSPQPAA